MFERRALAAATKSLGADHPTTLDYQRVLKDIEQKLNLRRETPWL
jgi:hypothetical protein